MYLSFSKSSFPRALSYTGKRRFFRIWREGTCYLLSKDSFRFCPEFRRQFQHVSLRRLLSKNSIFFVGDTRKFGYNSAHLFTPTAVQELINLIPISSDEKGTTSSAKASANHLAPSSSSTSFGHATQWSAFPSSSYQVGVMECKLNLVQNLNKAVCISHNVIPLRKVWIQLYSFQLVG